MQTKLTNHYRDLPAACRQVREEGTPAELAEKVVKFADRLGYIVVGRRPQPRCALLNGRYCV